MGVFPGSDWQTADPAELGFDSDKLAAVGRWQTGIAGDNPYRLLVVRHGRIAAEWNQGVPVDERQYQASAWKSTLSSTLAITIADGRIGSADDPVVDYYPELMDVPEGFGPKPGRHAFPENAAITFRQLIGNTSGYMKPGEAPGQKFHYQTFGMNILSHAIAATYNAYKTSDPEAGPGIGSLFDRWIRDPIGGSWTWRYQNFAMSDVARKGVFGYATILECTARDMARLGLLWLNDGVWDGQQIVPAAWLREATVVSDMVKAAEPEAGWRYGLGFWCNDQGRTWTELPRNCFAAIGAGYQVIMVCRDSDLVVVQSPGAPTHPYILGDRLRPGRRQSPRRPRRLIRGAWAFARHPVFSTCHLRAGRGVGGTNVADPWPTPPTLIRMRPLSPISSGATCARRRSPSPKTSLSSRWPRRCWRNPRSASSSPAPWPSTSSSRSSPKSSSVKLPICAPRSTPSASASATTPRPR